MNNLSVIKHFNREKRKSCESDDLNDKNIENNKQLDKLQKLNCNCLKRKIKELESYLNKNKNIEILDNLIKKIKIEEYKAYDYDIY